MSLCACLCFFLLRPFLQSSAVNQCCFLKASSHKKFMMKENHFSALAAEWEWKLLAAGDWHLERQVECFIMWHMWGLQLYCLSAHFISLRIKKRDPARENAHLYIMACNSMCTLFFPVVTRLILRMEQCVSRAAALELCLCPHRMCSDTVLIVSQHSKPTLKLWA